MQGIGSMKRRDRFAWVKVTVAALMLAAACGRGDGGPGPAYDPCAGKACGAACSTCDPRDTNCAETAVLKYCDSQGRCLSPYPVCPSAECKVDGDCPQIQSCAVCPDGSAACPEARCVDGQCFTRFPPCPSDCQTSEDCPQLGMPCQVCANGSVACPGSDCVGGKCVATYPRCDDYDPCQGKACGASCTVCNPQDPDCVETGVLKFCDAAGECRPSNPVCLPPGQCTTNADCPGVGACPRCPGDQCAELECVAGQCVFTCPPAPPPQCTSNDDCPALGMPCIPCPDGWSACPSVACESGACVPHFPTCDGHDPCSGKTCGDSCDLCGGACASPVATYCNATGQCTMGVPVCNEICRLPADPGPCLAYMPRFHFDEKTGKCTRFVYGGCAGNENNFETAEACVSACAPTAAKPCDVIVCDVDTQCLYIQGTTPVCAALCAAGDVCPPGLACGCGASCPNCENCLRACVPAP